MASNNSDTQNLRICVLGNAGSGKTTLALALARHFHLPIFHLDRELRHDHFVLYPPDELFHRHNRIIAGDRWVIDGNYLSLLSDRLERATVAIYLDISRTVSLPRIIRRYLRNSHVRESIPEGARNKLDWEFLKWSMYYSRKRHLDELKLLSAGLPHLRVIILRAGSASEWQKRVIKELEAMD
ncbi:AAA family ATPase [Patescibacteria group bacterium]|nr:AAA family ATPase [Patescibacteria group bacterium]